MAQATKIDIVPPPPPEPNYDIRLILSKHEAEAVHGLCSLVAGSPDHSWRKYTGEVSRALAAAGVKFITLPTLHGKDSVWAE